ncbi:MAG: hypothetical protein EOP81_14970 [Variovorax sp.]|nr:MAG: hypothetical protein EOP81_14970 [Variovorax sp.]
MPIANNEPLNPPPGFASWLDYVVRTFDYRSAAMVYLFDRDPVETQREIADAVNAELEALKKRANAAK